jgi:hypothetical protein
MGDCHSFDPGSKFGLAKKTNKKNKPNEHPGPGAAYFFGYFIFNRKIAKVVGWVGFGPASLTSQGIIKLILGESHSHYYFINHRLLCV